MNHMFVDAGVSAVGTESAAGWAESWPYAVPATMATIATVIAPIPNPILAICSLPVQDRRADGDCNAPPGDFGGNDSRKSDHRW